MAEAQNLRNRKFGRLRVVKREGSDNGLATWLCRCSCGGTKVVKSMHLLHGNTRSCGCLRREHASTVMSTHPRWRGKLCAVPHYEDDPAAIADYSGRLPWDPELVVEFKPDRALVAALKPKRPMGRPPLPPEERLRRELAKKANGRPSQDPNVQARQECLWRWEQAARAFFGMARQAKPAKPERAPSPKRIELAAPRSPAWTEMSWAERKAAIWARARAA